MILPLEGVRVIEVGQALAGPLAGVVLADMGADVIKIEKPDGGDDARIWGPPFGPDGETSLYFYSQNRNKRSVVLDLKSPADIEKLHRLCETADILIQNLRPGVVDEIGIGPEAMLAAPSAADLLLDLGVRLPGADAAEAGLRSAAAGLWRHDERDRPAGRPADLLRRLDQRQGDRACSAPSARWPRCASATDRAGCLVDTSLFETAVYWVEGQVNSYLPTGDIPKRHGTGAAVIVPYQIFETADRPLCLAAGNDRLWARCARCWAIPTGRPIRTYAKSRQRVKQQGRAGAADRRGPEDAAPAPHWIEAMEKAGRARAPR